MLTHCSSYIQRKINPCSNISLILDGDLKKKKVLNEEKKKKEVLIRYVCSIFVKSRTWS